MAKLNKVPGEVKVSLPKQEEPKKERALQEIQQEYSTLCARVGQLQYQVYTYQKDLELMNGQLRNLNFEAAAVQAKATQQEAK